MFDVLPVKKSVLEAWQVAEAGLPTRVVNSVRSVGVGTVGELRTWPDADLLTLRSLGKKSLDQIHYFFLLCERIEKGNQRFNTIREVLDIFLDINQFKVISLRYGFGEKTMVASRNWVTLQEIGNQESKTRERVRQVEETGKSKLRSHMAAVCLQPFYDFVITFIKDRSGTASYEDVAELQLTEAIGEINPCSIVLLLSDLAPDTIRFHNNFFTTLPPETTHAIETKVCELLAASPLPIGIDTLTRELIETVPAESEAALRRATRVIMDHHPDVGATKDHRYFLYTSSVMSILHELMAQLESPAHYRAVTTSFNEAVKVRSRKGAGYILEMLNRSDRCDRVDRGLYVLTS